MLNKDFIVILFTLVVHVSNRILQQQINYQLEWPSKLISVFQESPKYF